MKIEVLVSTMFQKDFELIKQMNLKGDSVIINQADTEEYSEIPTEAGKVKFISTTSRGLSISRNTAFSAARGDVCLIADDDVVYNDDYIDTIRAAYTALPQADIIIFDIHSLNPERPERDFGDSIFRFRLRRALQVVSYRISFKLASIKEKGITMQPIFGAGAKYSMGEENIFMRDCLRRGLKAYYYPHRIGEVTHAHSTWFAGYNEKYFTDLGAVYYQLFGNLYLLGAMWFLLTKRKEYAPWITGSRAIRCMIKGKREYEIDRKNNR